MYSLFDNELWLKSARVAYGLDYFYVEEGFENPIAFSILKKPFTSTKTMICLPYVNFTQLRLREGITSSELERLLIDNAQKRGMTKIEIRSSKELPLNWSLNTQYVSFIIDLRNGSDDVFNRMKHTVRKAIRKGQKNNLRRETGKHHFETFYNIYASNVKRLGTPVHSRKFFEELLKYDNFDILTIFTSDNIPVASVLYGLDETTLYSLWGGGLAKYNHLSYDNFKFWELIKLACEKKYQFFDYGRSTKDTGTYIFKQRWMAEEVQLYYYYYDLKHPNLIKLKSNNNPQIHEKIFAKCWSKLPLSIANSIGPRLRKYIP